MRVSDAVTAEAVTKFRFWLQANGGEYVDYRPGEHIGTMPIARCLHANVSLPDSEIEFWAESRAAAGKDER